MMGKKPKNLMLRKYSLGSVIIIKNVNLSVLVSNLDREGIRLDALWSMFPGVIFGSCKGILD